MYISRMEINHFRRFKDVNIKLGRYLTCISGQNGVGKSQILALLGNSGQIPKSMGTNLEERAFHADWAEIVKGDINHDSITSIKNALTIYLEDVPSKSNIYKFPFTEKLSFRTTWQSKKISIKDAKKLKDSITSEEALHRLELSIKHAEENNDNYCNILDRFRIIPEKNKERNTESKLEFPTYYLGLSRLYPVGESQSVKIQHHKLSKEQINYFKVNYQKIFDSFDEFDGLASMSISDNQRKHGLGIESKNYGPLGNSNGQDDLNQIIAAFASFKNLKQQMGENFVGGILLIDELDAALHPAAQNKLLDFMLHEARDIGIQVVFTTHSLSLIDHFKKLEKQQQKDSDEIVLTYITKGRGKIEIKKDPSSQWIKNELLTSTGGIVSRRKPKVPVLSEDNRANWFLKNALHYFEQDNPDLNNLSLDFLNFSSGWTNIVSLIRYDYTYFSNFITIFDADVPRDKLSAKLSGSGYSLADNDKISKSTLLFFPNLLSNELLRNWNFLKDNDYRPYLELEIWEFLYELDVNDTFYQDPIVESIPFYKRNLIGNGPDTYKKGNCEDRIKAWFDDNQRIVDVAVNYFIEKNEQVVKQFINSIIEKYNIIVQSTYPQLTTVTKIK